MSGEIRREKGREAQERQIINAVRGRFEASENAFSQVFEKTARRYQLYRGLYTGRFHPNRNNLHLPLMFSVIQSDVAHKVQSSFGRLPYVDFAPGGPEDAGEARRQTSLIAALQKDAGLYSKAYDMFLSADIYGVSVIQTGYRTKTEDKKVWTPVRDPYSGDVIRDERGQIVRTLDTQDDVVVYDGPTADVVDILDFFPQPGVPRIEDMDWVIRRLWLDVDVLRALAKDGRYDPIDDKKMSEIVSATNRETQYDVRHGENRNYMDYSDRTDDKLARPVEIWEMWGTLPDELVPPNGTKMRAISIANGSVLLRNRNYPYWHGRLPFRGCSPFQDPHYFHAPGKLEICEKLQMLANRLASQKADIVDLVADPLMIAKRDSGIDLDNLYARPGNIIMVDDDISTSIQPWMPDMRGVQQIYPELSQIWGYMQQGSGTVEDTVMGGSGVTKRQSATEFSGRQQAVANRLLMEIRLAEEQWIEPLTRDFRDLARQFMSREREARILGMDAEINPITGQRTQPQSLLGPMDLDKDYDVRARGATQMTGANSQQQLMGLLQTIGTIPTAMMQINWEAMMRQVFDTFEIENTNELLKMSPEQMAMQAQVLGVAPQQGETQAPGAAPQAPTDPMAQITQMMTGG